MTEPKQEYQTERKEPPNLRVAKCCASCRRFCFSWSIGNFCTKYETISIDAYNLCGDYEPE